jgi:RimJ/RimL family protein N-acetyltransferase
VTLRPLRETDAEELWDAGADVEELWRYMWSGPFPDLAAFQAHVKTQMATNDPLFYAICDRESGHAIGEAAYLRIEPRHLRVN